MLLALDKANGGEDEICDCKRSEIIAESWPVDETKKFAPVPS